MTPERPDRRWLWLAVAGFAILGVAAVVAAVMMLGGPSDRARDGAPEGDGGQSTTGTSSPAATDGVVPDSMSASASSLPSGGKVTRDTGQQTGTFVLRVFWWDDTERRAMSGPSVTWGRSGAWRPDTAIGSQTATIGPFPTGKTVKLTIRPDGASTKGVTVPLLITRDMLSSSERDGVHIEVNDSGVRVLGNPVENFEWNLAR